MDKMVSYKRYASNLVIANIIIALVWILLSVSLSKNLVEDNNRMFLISSLYGVNLLNLLGAYFGITGIIRRTSCELTTYYILSRIAIISESFLYLLILFTGKQNGYYHPVISSVQTCVSVIVIITQIWLLYETKNFENLIKFEDNDGFDVFRVRRMSSPPDITDIEKNSRVYSLTDQLMVDPNENSPVSRNFNSLRSPSMNLGSSPVYHSLSTPIHNTPLSYANHWYYPTGVAPPPYNNPY